jgi:hypothetical protein
MNRKQLTLLIVLGVVLGGLGYWVYNKKEAGYERGTASEEGTKLLKGLPASAIRDVTQLTIKQSTNEVNLAVQGERWTVKERGGYPANFNNISDTVRKIWDLKVAIAATQIDQGRRHAGGFERREREVHRHAHAGAANVERSA